MPVAGVELEGVDCATGVDGRNGVDIADRKLWLSRLQIVSCRPLVLSLIAIHVLLTPHFALDLEYFFS